MDQNNSSSISSSPEDISSNVNEQQGTVGRNEFYNNQQSETFQIGETDKALSCFEVIKDGLATLKHMTENVDKAKELFDLLKKELDGHGLLNENAEDDEKSIPTFSFEVISNNRYRGRSEFSSEVTPNNPYSRLMALERMGIVENYTKIQDYSVAIVGLGGVGSVAAEMLTRCGIGKLILFDYDKVEMANMNRMFYQPHDCGLYKVHAATTTLQYISKGVKVDPRNLNVTTMNGFKEFLSVLSCGGRNNSKVDLVLSCVDNYEARMAVNSACNELDICWFESGVSENAVSGHIQYIVPGESACFACAPPLIVASAIDERTLKREGVCAASLPTTMSVVAGLLVQNTLKKLLNFGEVSWYVGYDSLKDFFPKINLKPNPFCDDKYCIERQADYKLRMQNVVKEETTSSNKREEIIHQDNEYDIAVEGEDEENVEDSVNDGSDLVTGVRREYCTPDEKITNPDNLVQDTNQSLEELMSHMKNL